MGNPIKLLTKKERFLWILSLIFVTVSNFLSPDFTVITMIAAIVGVTAIIFGSAGSAWGQILISLFSILYAIISYRFRYWGEMITYLGMCLPMALWSIWTWIHNPSEESEAVVKINRLSRVQLQTVIISGVLVTLVFWRILVYFQTPNILFSTISITTSYFAAALVLLRSSYFSFWYASNDLVLIILWILASIKDPVYIPVICNFIIFFINDVYSLYSWKKREKTQK